MKSSILFACLMAIVCLSSLALAAPKSSRYRNEPSDEEQSSYRPMASANRARGSDAKANEDDNSSPMIFDESSAVDPEFASLTNDGSGQGADEDEQQASNGPSEATGAASSNENMFKGAQFKHSLINQGDSDEPSELASNIANAKVSLQGHDMVTAAGHHHHHKHHVKGWLEMGAHTGKKGSFGWHDKHPVGGKGRR